MADEEPGGRPDKEAEALDGHARDLISDLDRLRRSLGRSQKEAASLDLDDRSIGLLIIVTIAFAVLYNPKDPDGTEAAAGPLAGTWDMYWTNSRASNKGLHHPFIGAETGTVEILEDTTEYGTEFMLNGDTLWFTFTRVFISTPVSGPNTACSRNLVRLGRDHR